MTAQTTIEALLFELRDGLGALVEDGARGRLGRCNKTAIKQLARRLRKGGACDPKWSEADVQTLLLEWKSLQGGR